MTVFGEKVAPGKVSVALCTYEGAAYLREQLESILRQTHPVDELVVADDGSRDSTIAIVDAFAASLAERGSALRIRLLPSAGRMGVARNFERAVSACTGAFIALSDQDDVWHPRRIERQVDRLRARPSLTLVHSDADLVSAGGERLGGTLLHSLAARPAELEAIASGSGFEVLIRRNLVTGATVMFRRNLLESAAPFAEGWVHDEWLGIIAAATGEVDLIRESLISYRQHGANQIGASDPGIRRRLSRLVEPRGDRLVVLRDRTEQLVTRLGSLPAAQQSTLELARGKLRFETSRAALPRRQFARLPSVVGLLRHGDYAAFASQGRVDAVRDLMQPA